MPGPDRLRHGYAQSKWVAEWPVARAAARGLPLSVHRPSRIGADTGTGVRQSADCFASVCCSRHVPKPGRRRPGGGPSFDLVPVPVPVEPCAPSRGRAPPPARHRQPHLPHHRRRTPPAEHRRRRPAAHEGGVPDATRPRAERQRPVLSPPSRRLRPRRPRAPAKPIKPPVSAPATRMRSRSSIEYSPLSQVHRCSVRPQRPVEDLFFSRQRRARARVPDRLRTGTLSTCRRPGLDKFDLASHRARAPSATRAAAIWPGVVSARARNSRLR
ncbi:SDR family oxidoreductase [Streptomyces sp. NPDC003042]